MATELEARRANEVTSEDELRVVRYVNALYEQAFRAKAEVWNRVRRWEKMWKGDQWSPNIPKWRTRAISNFIFAIIETQVTWLAESKPKIIVDPLGPEDAEQAKNLEKIIVDYLWDELSIRSKIKRMIRSALIRGRGFLKVGWDPWARSPFGRGEVSVEYVPWNEIFLDPLATDYSKARYIIHARWMPRSEVARIWPDQGWRVMPGAGAVQPDGAGMYLADVDIAIGSGGYDGIDDGDRVLVKECWIKDDSVELHEEVNVDEHGETKTNQYYRLKYPNGRLIVVADNVVLFDGPSPYDAKRDEDIFPFVAMSAYEDDDSIWDLSEVSQLEWPQRVLNMIESRMVDYVRLVANTPWIKDTNSGVKSEDLTNQEGLVITKNPGSEVRRDPPPPLPTSLFQLYLQVQRNMETISGVHDVTQGRRPTGIAAASAIAQLQEAGQARIRDKARNRDDAILRLGRLMALRVIEFYGPERQIAIRGEGDQVQMVNFDIQQLRMGVDVRIIPGTSLDMNEQLRYQAARELLQLGALLPEHVLDVINFPNKEEIKAQLAQQRAMAAAQQAAGGQGGQRQGQLPPIGGPQQRPLALRQWPMPGPPGGF